MKGLFANLQQKDSNMKKLIALSIIFVSISIHAQDSSLVLKGYVMDEESGDTMMFANVSLWQNDVEVYQTAADLKGFYQFDSVTTGNYTLKLFYIGYKDLIIDSLQLEKTIVLNFYLKKCFDDCLPVLVDPYWIPIIEQDSPTGLRIDNKRIRKAATRSF
jgi:hypothetical protein